MTSRVPFADTGRTKEQERPGRPIRIRDAEARPADSIGNCSYRRILTHHALIEHGLHVEELGLALKQSVSGIPVHDATTSAMSSGRLLP